MKILVDRWIAKTPSFFKKVAIIGTSVASFGGGLLMIPNVPPKLSSIGYTMVWVGSTMALLSKFAVDDTIKDTKPPKADGTN